MKILDWLGKPVAVLLNQMGPPRPGAEELAEQQRWKQHLAQYPVVTEVLALDAFARCWVHEHVFYDAIGRLIDESKRPGYARLLAAWSDDNRARYASALRMSAEQIAAAARDSEPLPDEGRACCAARSRRSAWARTSSGARNWRWRPWSRA